MTSRDIGVGVGGCSLRQVGAVDAKDDTVDAEPGILIADWSFFLALA